MPDVNLVLALFDYLQNKLNPVRIDVKHQPGVTEAIWYGLPGSYKNCNVNRSILYNNKFSNFYELINEVLSIADITRWVINDAMVEDLQLDYMQINFETHPVAPQDHYMYATITCTFYFIFVKEDPGDRQISYRLLCNRSNEKNINNLLQAACLGSPDKLVSSDYNIYLPRLEQALTALAQHCAITLSGHQRRKYPGSLLAEKPTVADFVRIITLINYNQFKGNIQETARLQEQYFSEGWQEQREDSDYYTYRCQRLLDEASVIWIDWKFEAEDIMGDITIILGKPFVFDYPENTYSTSLYPYIQTELASMGLALMDMDTRTDLCNFIIVQLDAVPEIIELSNKLHLDIEICD